MNERSIGMRLAEALTKEQIVHLLDTAYRLWGKEAMKELISAVDEDVASTHLPPARSQSPSKGAYCLR